MIGFTSETQIAKTRKEHRCDGCGLHIDVGSSAKKWVGVIDGEFGSAYYHAECRDAEIAMNQEAGIDAEDWCVLHAVRDLDLEDWLLAEHPVAAARVGLVMSEVTA